MATRAKPLRDYSELTEGERKMIIADFKKNYLGAGMVEKWRLSREAFKQLKRESSGVTSGYRHCL
ncbi:hypothetical protein CE005_22975 [Salmonella enterica subsp. enterica serovar Mississippi]|nr:hypothetical protein [Salmonella enterica subsp. enterica serovar Mississippi]EGH3087067.1 hypothetical protein [Salmonella enterica]EID4122197.1 hypothetical protein [Salmonella enterica]